MRSMYGPDTLLLASKKPRIIKLVDDARRMTVAQIQALSEKPDVIRGLLLINEFESTRDDTKQTVPEKIADRMQQQARKTPSIDQLKWDIYVVTAHDFWLDVGSSRLEIKTGWHWAPLGNNQIYLSMSSVIVNSNALLLLTDYSRLVKQQGYIEDLRQLEFERLSRLTY